MQHTSRCTYAMVSLAEQMEKEVRVGNWRIQVHLESSSQSGDGGVDC